MIVIGAALGLAKALEISGTADLVAYWIIGITEDYESWVLLAGIVFVTAILTEIITNNGAVAIMFPIVFSLAGSMEIDPRALFVAVTIAASMSLISPIGYQTNLMVYGPGNYRFTDFFKVGFPLQIILWIVVIVLAPVIWPI